VVDLEGARQHDRRPALVKWIPGPGDLQLVLPEFEAEPVCSRRGIEAIAGRDVVVLPAPSQPYRLDEQIAETEVRVGFQARAELPVKERARTRPTQIDLCAVVREGSCDEGGIASAQHLPVTHPHKGGTERVDIDIGINGHGGRTPPAACVRERVPTSSPLRFFKVFVL
jgi:hypothetical protein